ncbi:hypothetical protein HNQ59_000316 [Chitinivorax tropicus]|uniref:Glycosyltransferase 2-like domain-containing protein n=1 Tax=Chitinivorax tropicus TaxID=714531 RepID=A0A840MCL8_9PROT|nr:glycosyltransferase family 2 protein [Chitinivorax tropicus]MBB5017054.1 hypothetical protein [Chitinivorax tropicus]
MALRVAIVILNWNGRADTIACVESVLANDHENFFVVVADNGSTDDSVRALRQQFPHITLVENGDNLGFAAGNNRGIEAALAAGAEVVVLLNNDTIVAPDWLSNLADAANQLAPGSVLGAKIFYSQQPEVIWHFGAHWQADKSRFQILGRGQTDHQWPDLQPVDMIIGCCMWIPRDTLQKVGLLEPSFFLNYEETDWCWRAKQAGVTCYSVPQAHLWHKISASFVGKPHNAYFIFRNRLLWLERQFSGLEYLRHYCRMALSEHLKIRRKLALRLLQIQLLKLLGKQPATQVAEKVAFYRAALMGVQDYRARRFGNCPPQVLALSKTTPPSQVG